MGRKSDVPLYEHQDRALALLDGRRAFALLMEMGTAKTRVILEDFVRHVRSGESMDLFVVAPAGVYRVWEGEILDWMPDDVLARTKVYTWKSDSSASERRKLKAALETREPVPRIFLVNVEALSVVKFLVALCKEFVSRGGATIVVDESTAIKNYKAERTKAVEAIGLEADRHGSKAWRRIASGLVAPRSPLDVFSQFYFLDPAILGYTSFFAFRARYAVTRRVHVNGPNKRPVDMVVGYRNVDELHAKIAKASFRVLKSECLQLPPKIYMPPRFVELTEEQRERYEEMRRTAMTMLENGTLVTSELAITTLTKLHQIASGFIIDELGAYHEIKNNRLAELLEVLEEHDGKAIVWAPFRKVIMTISEALRKKYGPASVVEYWGDTKSDARVEAVRRFQDDPDCKLFVGNPSTGGKGLTLTAASLVVYFANSWDLEHRLQSEDRAHRSGLTHSVTYVDLVARGTVDLRIVQALRAKIDLASTVNGDALKEWLV